MSKYHVVKCDNDNPFPAIVFFIVCIAIVIGVCEWCYHHILLPLFHFMLTVIIYGSVAIGLLLVILGGGFVLYTFATRRHVANARTNMGAIPAGNRARMVGQNNVATMALPAGTENPSCATGPLNFNPLDEAMESLTNSMNESADILINPMPTRDDIIIQSQDDAWMLMHGMRPINWK